MTINGPGSMVCARTRRTVPISLAALWGAVASSPLYLGRSRVEDPLPGSVRAQGRTGGGKRRPQLMKLRQWEAGAAGDTRRGWRVNRGPSKGDGVGTVVRKGMT